MLTEKSILFIVCLFCSFFLFGQARNLKPMTETELKDYERMLGSDSLNPYVPKLPREYVVKQLQDLHKVFVQSEVPPTLEEYLKHGSNQIPTRNRVFVYGNRLKTLIADPELLEVSGYELNWFRNVGNTIVSLADFHGYFVQAINRRDAVRYNAIYLKYYAAVKNLDQLMQNPVKLKPAELRRIKNANTNTRKRKYDLLEARYQYTLRLQEKANNRRQGAR